MLSSEKVIPQPTVPSDEASSSLKGAGTDTRIRARAIVLGLLLVPGLCWWGMRSEIINGGSEMIEASLLILVVFVLFVLVLLNQMVQRFRPNWALTRAELLVIYVMQTTSVGLAGLGQMQFLNQALGGAFHYATPENHWADFHQYIPHWWVPDPGVLDDYYRGHSTFFTSEHVRGWATPIVSWTIFIGLMMCCFLCLNTMLRRPWIEQEKLSFPLVALPLELTRTETTSFLLTQKSFWLAFSVVAVYRSISGIHRIVPTFPDFPNMAANGQLINLTGQIASTPSPWNATGYFVFSLHPIIVGCTYFIPQDVSFSLWFFYLIVKLENILAAALGFHDSGASAAAAQIPYTGEQGAGAFMALAVFSLWGARRHLAEVWKKAIGRGPLVRDSDEPLSYRTAVFGFIASFAGLVLFVALGGMAWYLAAAFFGVYLLMILTITRLRAEAGPMLNYGPAFTAHRMLVELPGSQSWNAQNLTPLTYLTWFDSDFRTVAMPQQMEAFKIADTVNLPARRLTGWILAAELLAAVSAFVTVLALYYHYGAASGMGDNDWRVENGQDPYQQLMDWLHNPHTANTTRLEWMGVGFLLVALLTKARQTFVWWPFHPAGFTMAHSAWAMDWIWFPTLLGWGAKALILRYGGIKLYRQAVPLFLGLILGDIVISCLWSILGIVLGVRMYMFFPG